MVSTVRCSIRVPERGLCNLLECNFRSNRAKSGRGRPNLPEPRPISKSTEVGPNPAILARNRPNSRQTRPVWTMLGPELPNVGPTFTESGPFKPPSMQIELSRESSNRTSVVGVRHVSSSFETFDATSISLLGFPRLPDVRENPPARNPKTPKCGRGGLGVRWRVVFRRAVRLQPRVSQRSRPHTSTLPCEFRKPPMHQRSVGTPPLGGQISTDVGKSAKPATVKRRWM